MSENLECLRTMRDNMRSGGHHAAQHAIDAAIEDIERLTADLDVAKQSYVHSCESITNKNKMILDRDKDIERLNQMIRETGQGQGAIDAYVAQCEELERLQTILSTPPTWLCADCRDQWLMRDAAEHQSEPENNWGAAPLPPREEKDGSGRLKCPGNGCAGIINKVTPSRCPNCLQSLKIK